MKSHIIDLQKLKKFDDGKCYKETVWSDDHGRISMLCMKPGQEIVTHTHHGSHIWTVVEGQGELLSGKESQKISVGQIVVVPAFEDHGIRNASSENLVIASIMTKGD